MMATIARTFGHKSTCFTTRETPVIPSIEETQGPRERVGGGLGEADAIRRGAEAIDTIADAIETVETGADAIEAIEQGLSG